MVFQWGMGFFGRYHTLLAMLRVGCWGVVVGHISMAFFCWCHRG
jgi:hypothetical protein